MSWQDPIKTGSGAVGTMFKVAAAVFVALLAVAIVAIVWMAM